MYELYVMMHVNYCKALDVFVFFFRLLGMACVVHLRIHPIDKWYIKTLYYIVIWRLRLNYIEDK